MTAILMVAGALSGAVSGGAAITVATLAYLGVPPAVVGTGVGAALGGAAGLLVGAASVNPYVAWSVFRPPFPQCAVGIVVGTSLAAIGLRVLDRRNADGRATAG